MDREFAHSLKRLRLERGLTQEELAHEAGFAGQSRIGNYERCRGTPSLPELRALARALGCRASELLGESADGAVLDPEKVAAVHAMVRKFYDRRGIRYDIESHPQAFVEGYKIGARIPEEISPAELVELGSKLAVLPQPTGGQHAERNMALPPARGTGKGMGKGHAGKSKAARRR